MNTSTIVVTPEMVNGRTEHERAVRYRDLVLKVHGPKPAPARVTVPFFKERITTPLYDKR